MEMRRKYNFRGNNKMKHLIMLIILFFLASVAAFIGGALFGSLGALIILVIGLFVAFVQISVSIGR